MGVNKLIKTVSPTASRLRYEPGPFCASVQQSNHSAIEPPTLEIHTEITIATRDVDGSSQFSADSQPKSIGLL